LEHFESFTEKNLLDPKAREKGLKNITTITTFLQTSIEIIFFKNVADLSVMVVMVVMAATHKKSPRPKSRGKKVVV